MRNIPSQQFFTPGFRILVRDFLCFFFLIDSCLKLFHCPSEFKTKKKFSCPLDTAVRVGLECNRQIYKCMCWEYWAFVVTGLCMCILQQSGFCVVLWWEKAISPLFGNVLNLISHINLFRVISAQ